MENDCTREDDLLYLYNNQRQTNWLQKQKIMATLKEVKQAYINAKTDAEKVRIYNHVIQFATDRLRKAFLVYLAVSEIELS